MTGENNKIPVYLTEEEAESFKLFLKYSKVFKSLEGYVEEGMSNGKLEFDFSSKGDIGAVRVIMDRVVFKL